MSHSFSAKLFSEKFDKEKIDAEYLLWETDDLAALINRLKTEKSLTGFNVTVPYKEDIIPLLDSISRGASEIGAVNTVKVSDNNGTPQLTGYNTDAEGFRQSLTDFLPANHQHMKALVLGTGGASKAVGYALRCEGITPTFISRNPREGILTYSMLTEEVIAAHEIIINTTPLGTFPDEERAPDIPYRFISDKHYCHDLVYNPEETLFMKNCRLQGAKVKNGLEMLKNQARAAWEIWQRNE